MRLVHTSDWHLGRMFHGESLRAAQTAYLDHLVEVVRSESIDAVLVSGDIYDRAMPSPETVQLLSQGVERLIDAGATVILSSGNHDSAIRLGFASSLLERAGLHIRSSLPSIGRPVELGDTLVYPLPYLDPTLTAGDLGAPERTHAGVLRAAMDRVREDRASRSVKFSLVMAHAFVTGGTSSDSERDISVGGVSAVPPEVFDGVDYVALGHLHGQQRVSEHVRYSGSPVAMSFGEAAHRKGSWILDLNGPEVATEFVDAPVERPLAVLRGDLEDLLTSRSHSTAESAYVRAVLTDPVRPLGAFEQLRRRFPSLLDLDFDPQGAVVHVSSYAAKVAARSELDVCCDFLAHVRRGVVATEDERDLLREAVEEARRQRTHNADEGVAAGAAARATDSAGAA